MLEFCLKDRVHASYLIANIPSKFYLHSANPNINAKLEICYKISLNGNPIALALKSFFTVNVSAGHMHGPLYYSHKKINDLFTFFKEILNSFY